MNKSRLQKILLGVGLLTLIGMVGAQAWYAHELAQRAAQAEPVDQTYLPSTTASATRPGINPGPSADPWLEPDVNPWAIMQADMRHMRAAMDKAVANFPALSAPAGDSTGIKVNLTEQDKDYVVTAQVPGAEQENLDVQLHGQLLSISSKSAGSQARTDDNGQTIGQESFAQSFQQAFTLPGPVDAAGMHTDFKDGVLTVNIPKAG